MVAREVTGIILASGMSRRFDGRNKLLAPVHGTAMVRRTVCAYLRASLAAVVVVVGHDGELVSRTLEGLPVQIVENPEYVAGQSRALARGVGALADGVAAAVIGVGDQPFLTAGIIDELVGTWRLTDAPLVAPRYAGQRGNPVLFDRALFGELLQIDGDRGGRSVLERHREHVVWLDVPEARNGADIDTLEDYRRLAQ